MSLSLPVRVDKIEIKPKSEPALSQNVYGFFELAVVGRENRELAVMWTHCKDYWNEYLLAKKHPGQHYSVFGYSTAAYDNGIRDSGHSILVRASSKQNWYGLRISTRGIAEHVSAGLDCAWAALTNAGYTVPQHYVYYDNDVVEIHYDNEFWEATTPRLALLICFIRAGKELQDLSGIISSASQGISDHLNYTIKYRMGGQSDINSIMKWATHDKRNRAIDEQQPYEGRDMYHIHGKLGIGAALSVLT